MTAVADAKSTSVRKHKSLAVRKKTVTVGNLDMGADTARLAKVAATAAPLGPDSLTWKYFGRLEIGVLLSITVALLENAHPSVGEVVDEHSKIFQDPVGRALRSIPPILAVVYDPDDPDYAGRRVRDFHKGLTTVDDKNRVWTAVRPDVFYWTHATFVDAIVRSQELFGKPFTQAEKDQLIAESITWWRRYGVRDIAMPTDWAEFQAYWDSVVDQFEHTKVTRMVADRSENPFDFGLPPAVWNRVSPYLNQVVMPVVMLIAVGAMTPRERAAMGAEWTWEDEVQYQIFRTIMRIALTVTPMSIKQLPPARPNKFSVWRAALTAASPAVRAASMASRTATAISRRAGRVL